MKTRVKKRRRRKMKGRVGEGVRDIQLEKK